MKLYWDDCDGSVTHNPECALITDGKDIYIETYELTNGMRMDIAYSQMDREMLYNLNDLRDAVCRKNGYKFENLKRLVRFAVPSNVYESLQKLYGK